MKIKVSISYPTDDFDIGTRSIQRCHGIYDADDVALDVGDPGIGLFALGHIAKVLDEVHDVRTVVHGTLEEPSYLATCIERVGGDVLGTYTLELLEDARVQVLVHVAVLEREVGGLLGRVDGGIEVREVLGEAHAHFERVGHPWSVARRTRWRRWSIRVGA